jgi:hypothetical protein
MNDDKIPRTYRSGQWMVVECRQGLDTSSATWLRDILNSLKDATWSGVIMDLGTLESLDPTSKRLLQNFHKGLVDQGRSLGVVTDREELRKQLFSEGDLTLLSNLSELKRSIHEMPSDRLRQLQTIGARTSNLISFRLRCPVCRSDDVRGWLADPAQHRHVWKRNEVTRQLVPLDTENALDVDVYSVAVCPECLFASSRIDWFDIPGSRILSSLPEGSAERLSKGFIRRRQAIQELSLDVGLSVFFGMPRLPLATQTAWLLCEESIRAVGRDRTTTDGFSIAIAIIMQAKFAPAGSDLSRYYTAAYVWLRQIADQVGNYAEERLLEANIYLLSVTLALGRDSEAQQVARTIEGTWGKDPDLQPWVERARQLIRE